jgi:hypothetical protein
VTPSRPGLPPPPRRHWHFPPAGTAQAGPGAGPRPPTPSPGPGHWHGHGPPVISHRDRRRPHFGTVPRTLTGGQCLVAGAAQVVHWSRSLRTETRYRSPPVCQAGPLPGPSLRLPGPGRVRLEAGPRLRPAGGPGCAGSGRSGVGECHCASGRSGWRLKSGQRPCAAVPRPQPAELTHVFKSGVNMVNA